MRFYKKWLWKKLEDPADYQHDPIIKRDNEIYHELLHHIIILQKRLLPAKINYFFKHDKFFFLRLFFKLFRNLILTLLSFVVVASIGLSVAMFVFGVKINLKAEPIKKETRELIIKIDDTTNLNFYKENLTSKNGIKIKFVVRYVYLPTKNYDKWVKDLCALESKDWENPYEARRPLTDKKGNILKDEKGNILWSQFWGKYQMGTSARDAVKMGRFTWDEWRKNPALQEGALRLWIDILYSQLKPDIKRYNDKILNGIYITTSGIIAMAHNVGPAATREFLISGGKVIPVDGSGKAATRFLVLGGYDLGFE